MTSRPDTDAIQLAMRHAACVLLLLSAADALYRKRRLLAPEIEIFVNPHVNWSFLTISEEDEYLHTIGKKSIFLEDKVRAGRLLSILG